MKRFIMTALALASITLTMTAKTKKVTIRVVETSDVHGSFFPWDFITGQPKEGSLARVCSYVNKIRQQGENLILLENGDILQGQPTCYYYNYVATQKRNVAADVVNYMKYDAQTWGNHDVETGHAVYDKWMEELDCPVLGANIICAASGEPYVKPYTIVERDGVRVALIGMLTPAIPNWLPKKLWSGLRFEEMVSCARKWVAYVKEHEQPDVIIGMFHSGKNGGISLPEYDEDASEKVAQQVPGFDLVVYGHDHTRHNDTVKNTEGKDVVCLDPANNALAVCDATITVEKNGDKVISKSVKGEVVDMRDQPIDEQFTARFLPQIDEVKAWVNKPIGTFTDDVLTRDSYFGPSAYIDLVHNLQLQITGADISFNAPLLFNSVIHKGEVKVADMFSLYKYENMLYVLRMTGREIRKHLEMSYDLWVNTMKSPDDHLLLLSERTKGDQQRLGFKNFSFNFDSAAGIDYEVDVTKPDGEKVKVLRMSNGEPFDENRWYKVAMNSYRGNGGGELLTAGAGIPHDSLESRIVYKSDLDLRHYLTKEIEKLGTVTPKANNNWRFVPDAWTNAAAQRDKKMLFGE